MRQTEHKALVFQFRVFSLWSLFSRLSIKTDTPEITFLACLSLKNRTPKSACSLKILQNSLRIGGKQRRILHGKKVSQFIHRTLHFIPFKTKLLSSHINPCKWCLCNTTLLESKSHVRICFVMSLGCLCFRENIWLKIKDYIRFETCNNYSLQLLIEYT